MLALLLATAVASAELPALLLVPPDPPAAERHAPALTLGAEIVGGTLVHTGALWLSVWPARLVFAPEPYRGPIPGGSVHASVPGSMPAIEVGSGIVLGLGLLTGAVMLATAAAVAVPATASTLSIQGIERLDDRQPDYLAMAGTGFAAGAAAVAVALVASDDVMEAGPEVYLAASVVPVLAEVIVARLTARPVAR